MHYHGLFTQPQETTSSSNATNSIIKAGPFTAIRHVFDDPTLRVFNYCTPYHSIMAVRSLFDTKSKECYFDRNRIYANTTRLYETSRKRKTILTGITILLSLFQIE